MAKFCTNCGQALEEDLKNCPNCGAPTKKEIEATNENNKVEPAIENETEGKSKMVAAILALLLGMFGAHNFYLGYTGKAIAQLLLSLVGWILCCLGPIAAGIWGLIEGIMILTGSINVDANGNKIKE